VFFTVFVVINTLGKTVTPLLVSESVVGYSLLMFAISLSNNLSQNKVIASLGICSFGIYFLHHLVINYLQTLATKIIPYSMKEVSIMK
jgi:peptidoglycan/LPS O-acetylase OafA/YrhL